MQHRCSERLTPPLSGGHPLPPGPRAVLGLPLDATRAEAPSPYAEDYRVPVSRVVWAEARPSVRSAGKDFAALPQAEMVRLAA
jgi:hypothetical protein